MNFDNSKRACFKKVLLAELIVVSVVVFLDVSVLAKNISAPPAVAVIDLKKVTSRSKAGRGIEEQAASKNNTSKKELIDLEDKIKSMESNKLSGSDPRKIEELQLLLYDMVKEKRFQISEAYRRAIEVLESVIKEIIEEVCAEKCIDVVVTNEAVVYRGENCCDITEEVIRRLDERCKEIILKMDEEKTVLPEEVKAS